MPIKVREGFMPKPLLSITREKHLDHLVRVIPFIVMLYGIQSYALMSLSPMGFTYNHIVFLGAALCATIGSFIIYNLKHRTDFYENHLEVSFLGWKLNLNYDEIHDIIIPDEEQSFATLTFVTKSHRRHKIYFVDEVQKIKQWVQTKKATYQQAA
jgi:hypothetical protein